MPQSPVPSTRRIGLRCASIYCSACANSTAGGKSDAHQAIANCCGATFFCECSIGGTPRLGPLHRAWHSAGRRPIRSTHERRGRRASASGSGLRVIVPVYIFCRESAAMLAWAASIGEAAKANVVAMPDGIRLPLSASKRAARSACRPLRISRLRTSAIRPAWSR